MNDSKQLAILKALTAVIELVNPDTDYDFDLRGQVFRGRTVFGSESTPPFVSILEAPKPGETFEVGVPRLSRQTDWPLLIQGWATDDKTNPLDPAYGLKASVEQVLSRIAAMTPQGTPAFPTYYLLGRRIISAAIGPGVCRPPTEVSPFAFFYLPVTVVYGEDLSKPFT